MKLTEAVLAVLAMCALAFVMARPNVHFTLFDKPVVVPVVMPYAPIVATPEGALMDGGSLPYSIEDGVITGAR